MYIINIYNIEIVSFSAIKIRERNGGEKYSQMDIVISNSGAVPIYEQIVSQIKGLIISGKLKEGDALPSMRILAKELRISVITTKRAYEELEHEGFIVSITGKGSFVAERNMEIVREEYLKNIEFYMQKIYDESVKCNLTLEEIMEMFEIVFRGE